MTTTRHNEATTAEQRVAFGGYRLDGVEHNVVAARDDSAPWRLFDIAGNTTIVIESFYADEAFDAVQAVAEMYLTDVRL
jgi:hypothetical protein